MCTKNSEVFAKTGLFLEHLVAYFSLWIILIITHSSLIKNYSSNLFLKLEPHMYTKQTILNYIICTEDFIKLHQTVRFHGILSIYSPFITNLVIFVLGRSHIW